MTDVLPSSTAPFAVARRPFWRAPSLLIAGALTILGALLWFRAPAATPPAPVASPSSGSSFATTRSQPASPAREADRPFIGKEAPLLFRFGAAYLGGFVVGWAWRKSVKVALSLGGTALALIGAAKYLGVGGADLQAVQTQVAEGMGWLQQQAGVLREWLSGYLPSGFASVVGLWRGARWK